MIQRLITAVVVCALPAGATAFAAPPSGLSVADCDRTVRAQPAALDAYLCYFSVAHGTGDFAQPRARLAAVLERNPSEPRALAVLAAISDPRETRSSIHMYRSAARLAEESGDEVTEIFARTRLSALLVTTRQLDQAGQEIKPLEDRFSPQQEPLPLALARARLDYAREDYAHATIVLKEVESRMKQAPPRQQAEWFGQMATISWATGLSDRAHELYTHEADLLHAIGDRYGEAVPRVNVLLVTNGTREEMRRRAEAALALAKSGGNLPEEGRAAFFLAQFTLGPEALTLARQSLDIARRTGSDAAVAMGLRATAFLTLSTNRTEAYRLIDEAIARARARGDRADEARNRVLRSRMSWTSGPREQAIDDSLSALTAIEADRDLQPDSLVRAQRFAAWRAPYTTLVGRLLAGDPPSAGQAPSEHDLALAFETTERMRARALLDSMDAAQATAALARGADQEQGRKLAARLADVRRRLLDPTLDASERDEATSEFERLEREVSETRAAQASVNPAYASLRPRHLATLDDIADHLNEDEALLSFQASWDSWNGGNFLGGSWVFVRTRQKAAVYRLASLDDIASRVQLFLGLVERRDGGEAQAASRLYRDLLGRPLADLPASIEKLVIVPDDVLASVPFDALRPRPDSSPLALRYEISLAPSATVWLRWRTQPVGRPATAALVVAAPDLSSLPTRPTVAMAGVSPTAFRPLTRAGREGRIITSEIGGNSELRLGTQASKSWLLRQDLSRFGIVHFATHAVVDESHPDRSALLLASSSNGDDGLLRPREVVGLHLTGQIVVLSACLTASGAVVGGDGIMGLSHAFFEAGAHGVVGSLWPLEDEEAMAMMAAFYRHLGRGESSGAAMTAARREHIASGEPTAAWSGLVFIGDTTLAPGRRADGKEAAAGWIALSTLALLALTVAIGRFRRPRTTVSARSPLGQLV